MLTPVPNPAAYGLVETDASGRVRRFIEKPTTPARSPPTPSTPASTCWTRARSRSCPPGENHSIERAFFPALLRRGDLVRACVHRGYWIDIGTPEKYLQVHRDILGGALPRRSSTARPATGAGSTRTRGSTRRAELEGPFYVGPGCRVEAGAHVGPGRRAHRATSRSRAGALGARLRASGRAARSARVRQRRGRAARPRACAWAPRPPRARRRARRGHGRQRSLAHALTALTRSGSGRRIQGMSVIVDPGIFKAYDIRAIYPSQIDGEVARRVGPRLRGLPRGRAQAHRRRPRRARSRRPRSRASFIEGARSEGAEVTDIGVVGHRHDVLPRRSPGPRRRRHHHRLPQPEGVQRHQDGAPGRPRALAATPASRRSRRRSSPAASPTRATREGKVVPRTISDDYADHCLVVHRRRPRSRASRSCSTPATAWAPSAPRRIFKRLPARARQDVLRPRRHLPEPPARPARGGEPPRDRGARAPRRRRRPRHRLGRRRRPLLLRRRHRRVRARRLRDRAPRRGVRARRSRAPRSSTTCAPRARCATACRPRAARPS